VSKETYNSVKRDSLLNGSARNSINEALATYALKAFNVTLGKYR
jgi:hypothetical protein